MKDGGWFFLFALLGIGAVVLLSSRSVAAGRQTPGMEITRIHGPTKQYRNKEIRKIEYNEDGLPVLIEITRDYTLT